MRSPLKACSIALLLASHAVGQPVRHETAIDRLFA